MHSRPKPSIMMPETPGTEVVFDAYKTAPARDHTIRILSTPVLGFS
jgi:hypothetical protein